MFEFCRSFVGGYGVNGTWWMGGIAMVIGLVLVGVVIYLLVSNTRRTDSGKSSDALDILKARLAKGEIDEETYERLLKKVD